MKYATTVGNQTFIIEINERGEAIVDGQAFQVDFESVGAAPLYSLLINNESFEALVERRGDEWHVLMHGDLYTVRVSDERTQRLAAAASSLVPETGDVSIRAPMPGLVVAVPVTVGQAVEAGDVLVILESMKMENELKAPRAAVVERVHVRAGDSVEQSQTLVVVA
jgi:biotin carboxyl carrier protein